MPLLMSILFDLSLKYLTICTHDTLYQNKSFYQIAPPTYDKN